MPQLGHSDNLPGKPSSGVPLSSSQSQDQAAEPQQHASTVPMDRDESDDGWEYEYDTNETDHFYLTLDLTSKVPPQQRRRRTSISYTDPTTDEPPTLSNPDSIQILELHSDNPLIAHQDKLYSCHWASAVGTDLLFTLPADTTSPDVPVAPELEHATTSTTTAPTSVPPLRKTADYTILAATPHRLVCVPAVRKPKLAGDDGPSLADRPQRLHENSQRTAQAAFLQQLADLKVQKGQTDKVPMHTANSAGRPRTIIRPLLPTARASESHVVASDAPVVPLPAANQNEDEDEDGNENQVQSQPGQSEGMDVDEYVDVEVDDADADADEAPMAPTTPVPANTTDPPQPPDNQPSTPRDTSKTPLAESTPLIDTPASTRRESARRRGGRPAGRVLKPLARDNVIGGLVGDTVADDTPHVLRAFEESTAYMGLQAGEQSGKKRGGARGGRRRGGGKGGARVGGKRRVGETGSDADAGSPDGGTGQGEVGVRGESSTSAVIGDSDVEMDDA